MSTEIPGLGIDDWSQDPLDDVEIQQLVHESIASVSFQALSAGYVLGDLPLHYQLKFFPEDPDDHHGRASLISINALHYPEINDWEHSPEPFWIAKFRLDERVRVLGMNDRAPKLYRRNYLNVNPTEADPIRVVRNHEIMRRSLHRFSRPRTPEERDALKVAGNYETTQPTQGDGLLLRGMIEVLYRARTEAQAMPTDEDESTDNPNW